MPEAERPPHERLPDDAGQTRLVAVAARMLSTLEAEDVAERIVSGALSLFGASRSALLAHDPLNHVLTGITGIGVPEETLRAARIPISESRASSGGALDPAEHPNDSEAAAALSAALGFDAFGCIPLRTGDELSALVVLDVAPEQFSDAERELAREFAELASIALANARTHGRARLGAALAAGSRAAQELHNTVLQELFAIGVRADELRQAPPGAGADHALQSIIQLANEAALDMRRAIQVLRLGKPSQIPLGPALEQLANEVRTRSGLEIALHVDPALADRDDEVAEVVYRLGFDAIGNAEHHPVATGCRVSCTVENGWVQAVVEHNGGAAGYFWHSGRFGLAFLRELVESLGGGLELQPVEGGEELTARLPWEATPA
jgi:two-component system, NarL family, sensor histidine kinase DevS